MKTIIYIRTSTEDQNPENQLKDCLSLLKNDEYEIIEDKQSAWKEHKEREGFNKVKNEIKKQKLQKLIVWDLDRIYRNRKNLVDFFKLCEINKCQIHSFRQKWLIQINEMPSPWNEIIQDLMIQIIGWLAQDESDKKSERIRNAMRVKKSGVYSYKGNRWGRKEISSQAIKKILLLHQQGKKMKEICNEVSYSDRNNNKKNVSIGLVHKVLKGKHRKMLVENKISEVGNL